MKWLKFLIPILMLAAAATSTSAWADRGHGHFHHGARVGVYFGGPLFWPGYAYPPSYYYSPPLVVAPSAPLYYVEKGQEPLEYQPEGGANDWYYCSDPDGYYPYVKQCRNAWQRVAPQPPSAR